ncbi:apolipoprotein N-acyltransferase [Pseudooceanicola nanhaiensis]|uniref:apolipoprotein N-acyltransferase n=1 Tax=Pseudooceanicola nanhaiensis TaxID=375761 RepID=UPI001CD3BA95|nr:apolipoprotein N-acyltransferase [Pseudooceanicola nanhaiensis]MCA0922460.1 apolipoprotein N-acyltransferase [Pseudooceanicola nanhaiensis]
MQTLVHWIAGCSRRARAGLSAGAGLVLALGQAPVDLWPVAPLGAAGLFLMIAAAPSRRGAFFAGWSGGGAYFALSLSWIVEPFMVDVARHGWMAPFALVFMAFGLALFWGAAALLAREALLWRRTAPERTEDGRAYAGVDLLSALAVTGALGGAELLRAYVFTGFPWATIGHGLIGSPLLPLARIAGAGGLTFVLLALGAGLVLALYRPWPRLALWGGALAALFGTATAIRPHLPIPEDAPIVRLVQPNASQRDKWRDEMVAVFFDRMVDFTAAPPRPPATRRPDVVVWPETALAWPLEVAEVLTTTIMRNAGGSAVVVGANRRENGRWYNALALLGRDGTPQAIYDKSHLVPFGEYIPFGDLLGSLGIQGMATRDGYGFSSGPGPALVDLPGIGPALPLICYEAVFPQDILDAPARPRMLLQITNDAWFGNISGPYQHLAQARLRAAEQALPLARVANTGVSAMIDASGAVTGSLPLNEAGWRDMPLPSAGAPTLYSRTGDWPIAALFLICLLIAPALQGRRTVLYSSEKDVDAPEKGA